MPSLSAGQCNKEALRRVGLLGQVKAPDDRLTDDPWGSFAREGASPGRTSPRPHVLAFAQPGPSTSQSYMSSGPDESFGADLHRAQIALESRVSKFSARSITVHLQTEAPTAPTSCTSSCMWGLAVMCLQLQSGRFFTPSCIRSGAVSNRRPRGKDAEEARGLFTGKRRPDMRPSVSGA